LAVVVVGFGFVFDPARKTFGLDFLRGFELGFWFGCGNPLGVMVFRLFLVI
jgi:hypothetical protein